MKHILYITVYIYIPMFPFLYTVPVKKFGIISINIANTVSQTYMDTQWWLLSHHWFNVLFKDISKGHMAVDGHSGFAGIKPVNFDWREGLPV